MTASDKKHEQSETEAEVNQQNADEATASADAMETNAREAVGLEKELASAREEATALLDQLKRSQAELENYRKRTLKEFEQMQRYQALPLARDLLPGLDNLERALKAAKSSSNIDELVQGVEMVARQFEDVLSRHSVKPVSAVGEPFDPNLHEAILQVPTSDHPPMTVIDEAERGYVLHDRVVRPSKVVVSQAPPAPVAAEAPPATEEE